VEELIHARPVIPGEAEGMLMVSSEPLSFWGGYDQQTGEIIDRRHPLSGRIAAGHVLALPFTRGSSTTTAVLLEAVRVGVAPAALLSTGVDTCFALASIVAKELYARSLPVLVLRRQDFDALASGPSAAIMRDGKIILSKS
jgi:hypothetical protein|tara:strand:+ start:1758 stop:2180 length:423 start_codon:yes stop_codon:yes gene_type:complete